MDNPAEYMLQFFNCEEREDGFDDNISKAFGQMHDTETCLNDLLSMNVRRLDTAKSVMPRNLGETMGVIRQRTREWCPGQF